MTVYTHANHNNHLSQCLPSCEEAVIQPSKNLFKTLTIWNQRIQQRKHLAKLDDRMLEDIGLNRADVDCEINKPFWK
ncbi:DUF1127 domain-containing protein [Cocleimonas sp. KMM 6892]|uniref:DUF1127 domain-containing protein n=1 Tax=unclassified Cocleimonas TaxID=2639732 RepID=UPI002DB9AD7B|nr:MULTISPECIES: DUF1127 domain-containing protein [unclassified Cocleimonas]MEB8432503.1 DUF1127 domain-containing protein [Cocleimonas sp. KMM 6892]MEC4715362.1 DUF1127 domain-containing protein [Cocleimonas sp. KMM 6895]MEC4745019.1 DUF1127 domain-containing protein [Cocleimonas sp. KMM 6896]